MNPKQEQPISLSSHLPKGYKPIPPYKVEGVDQLAGQGEDGYFGVMSTNDLSDAIGLAIDMTHEGLVSQHSYKAWKGVGLAGLVYDGSKMLIWDGIEYAERFNSPALETAIELANKAHQNQVDKIGEPYIEHPLRVMVQMDKYIDMQVAVLHDVVEDTNTTIDDLRKDGVDEIVINAVDAVTKRDGEAYETYLARVKANKVALRVKLADIADNLDPERLSKLPVETQEKLKKKYEFALGFLNKQIRIAKIVSGYQTGGDRGGIEAAIHCSIPYGGWIPAKRKAEDGEIPAKYVGLKETASSDYKVRTEANVADSDATVVFTYGQPEGGSKLTIELARKHNKPCLHVDLDRPRPDVTQEIIIWIRTKCPDNCVLNVAGSRESKSQGIMMAVMVRMVDVISSINGRMFYSLSDDYEIDDKPESVLSQADVERLRADIKQHGNNQLLFHPKTIDEAVQIVMDNLKNAPHESINNIKNMPKDDFLEQHHFGMGLWVRNAMIHQNNNIIDLLADYQRITKEKLLGGHADPDDVSHIIIERVWERLKQD